MSTGRQLIGQKIYLSARFNIFVSTGRIYTFVSSNRIFWQWNNLTNYKCMSMQNSQTIILCQQTDLKNSFIASMDRIFKLFQRTEFLINCSSCQRTELTNSFNVSTDRILAITLRQMYKYFHRTEFLINCQSCQRTELNDHIVSTDKFLSN